MPKPISWQELIRKLRRFQFTGPEWGGKHPFMVKGSLKLRIPNNHGNDIGPSLLKEILRQAGISTDQWNRDEDE